MFREKEKENAIGVKNNSCLEILDTASVNKILLHRQLILRLPPGLFQREVLNVHRHSFSKHFCGSHE